MNYCNNKIKWTKINCLLYFLKELQNDNRKVFCVRHKTRRKLNQHLATMFFIPCDN